MTDSTEHDQLSAYLDGELSHAEAAEVAQRIQADPALRAELEAVRGAVSLLRTHGPATMPASVAASIRDAVAREPAPGGALVWLHRPFGIPLQSLAVAAVALVVVGVALSGGARLLAQPAQVGVGPERGADGAGAADEFVVTAPRDAGAPDRAGERGAMADERAAGDPKGAAGEAKGVEPLDGAGMKGADGADAPVASGTSDASAGPDDPASPNTSAIGSAAPAGAASAPNLYGGASLHTVGLRESDLVVVARLLSRHGAIDGQGRDPASRVAELGPGEHDLAVLLPTAAARNAFVSDLRRTFASSHTERVVDDGSLSLAGAQVGLKLVVTPYVPARAQKARAGE